MNPQDILIPIITAATPLIVAYMILRDIRKITNYAPNGEEYEEYLTTYEEYLKTIPEDYQI